MRIGAGGLLTGVETELSPAFGSGAGVLVGLSVGGNSELQTCSFQNGSQCFDGGIASR